MGIYKSLVILYPEINSTQIEKLYMYFHIYLPHIFHIYER